ncbi:hypothetical protein KSP39_PZI000749 [Platanthera zijinensis]|uniref:Uncharacterized protein n=1 Tax=Platanthera zijinensis TaxID=2320716 RepID=A0AAP0C2Y7_9ASPA
MDERPESSQRKKYTIGDADPAVREYLLDLDEEHSRQTAQLTVQHDQNIISLKSHLAFFNKYLYHLNLELDGYRRRHSPPRQPSPVAGVICNIIDNKCSFLSAQSIAKDFLGIVASLGKVADNENLRSILSEYLGKETMLAIVCRTPAGEGRFVVYCLEMLWPFIGSVRPGDRQRRLALVEPRLPGGNLQPRGFLGFAVNMIYLDEEQLAGVTSDGRGLRETLFYTLFSRLQVYENRRDMIEAMPFITDDAVSLDGGIIKSGVCSDYNRPAIQSPVKVVEIEEMIKFTEWKKEVVLSEIQSEEVKIDEIKSVLKAKAQVYKKFMAEEIESRRRR